MINQTSLKQKYLYVPLALAVIATGCGDGSSSDQPNTNSLVTQTEMTNNPNDGTTVNNPDGGTVVSNPNDGTTVTNPNDGTIVTNPNDGTTVTNPNDGTTVTTPNDGTTVTTPNDGTTVTNPPVNTNVQRYEDAFVQLNYPEGWILNTSLDGVSAQFLEPGVNGTGGTNNCGLSSEPIPGSSLMQGIDAFLTLYDDNPEPQVSFVNVNGVEMVRIQGLISLFGVTVDSSSQLAYVNEVAHSIVCVGVGPEDVALIFDSMVIR